LYAFVFISHNAPISLLKNLTPRLQFDSSSCVDAVKLSWLEITFHCYSFGEILTSKIGHTDLVFGV